MGSHLPAGRDAYPTRVGENKRPAAAAPPNQPAMTAASPVPLTRRLIEEDRSDHTRTHLRLPIKAGAAHCRTECEARP